MRLIVDNYFKQFKAEINRIKLNVTNDIRDMKSDLIKLYYETTSTTESVDAIIVHYIENKTNDLETYVKQFLHSKNNVNNTTLSPIHRRNNTSQAVSKSVMMNSRLILPMSLITNTSAKTQGLSQKHFTRNNFSHIKNPIRRIMSQNKGSTNKDNKIALQADTMPHHNVVGVVNNFPLVIKKNIPRANKYS